jgi:ribosomal protein L37E
MGGDDLQEKGALRRRSLMPRARDNARPAAAEWGTRGPRGAVACGFGAQPRLPRDAEWGTRGPRGAVACGFGAQPRLPRDAEWGTRGPRGAAVGFGAQPRLMDEAPSS